MGHYFLDKQYNALNLVQISVLIVESYRITNKNTLCPRNPVHCYKNLDNITKWTRVLGHTANVSILAAFLSAAKS